MLNRFHSVSARWGLTSGLLLVALSALVLLRADDRVRLGPDVLVSSRGRNPMNVLSSYLCNVTNGNFPCSELENGDDCTTCEHTSYTDTTPGANGGYTIQGINNLCGWQANGTCNGDDCDDLGDPTGDCSNPAVTVQTE